MADRSSKDKKVPSPKPPGFGAALQNVKRTVTEPIVPNLTESQAPFSEFANVDMPLRRSSRRVNNPSTSTTNRATTSKLFDSRESSNADRSSKDKKVPSPQPARFGAALLNVRRTAVEPIIPNLTESQAPFSEFADMDMPLRRSSRRVSNTTTSTTNKATTSKQFDSRKPR